MDLQHSQGREKKGRVGECEGVSNEHWIRKIHPVNVKWLVRFLEIEARGGSALASE